MLLVTRVISPSLIVAAGLLPVAALGQKAASLPEWTPEKNQIKNLAAPRDLGEYTIRPPKAFERLELPKPASTSKTFGWAGARRDDGARPSFTGLVYTPPPGQNPELTLEQVANRFLEGFKKQHTEWHAEKFEEGTVNGIKFVRIRWKGTDRIAGVEKEGILYIAKDGGKIVQLGTQDIVPATKETLPLGEAALLTFKKK